MATSFTRYTGDGATTDYNVTFGYIDKSHVGVKVDGSAVTFSWLSATQVRLDAAPASAAVVEVRRTTPTTPIVDFVDGSVLLEADLDTSSLQAIYLSEEANDNVGDALQDDGANVWDAESKRIKDVADPVNDQDAVTKKYAADNYSGAAAAASAAAAATSEANAATSATNAATSETNAAASAAAAAGKVDKGGDTMTGLLTLSGAPTVDLHAATKKYADDADALRLLISNIASQAEAEAGTENTKYMTALRTAQAVAALGSSGSLKAVTVFTASGTWTPDAGATSALIFCTGGGEDGDTHASNGMDGGGAGGTAIKFVADTTVLTSESVTIGASGGGTSSVGTLASAAGGSAKAGGVPTIGDMLITGGKGGDGGGAGDPSHGEGGASFWGGGGDGAYGAGGLGDEGGSGATNGKAGVVLVLEW